MKAQWTDVANSLQIEHPLPLPSLQIKKIENEL